MKTIEMKARNKEISFTTKSVTIDGTEYFYGRMSEIRHSSSQQVYAFKYNGEVKYLPYDPKYGDVLNAIFKQVTSLRKAKAVPATETPVVETPVVEKPVAEAPVVEEPAPVEVPVVEAPVVEEPAPVNVADVLDSPEEADNEDSIFNIPASDNVAEPVAVPVETAPAQVEELPESSEPKEEKVDEKEEKTEEKVQTPEDKKAEKKGKLKKSFLILAAIIVLIAGLTVGYFMLFGTSDNPNAGPNSTETQQYDDIDQLIEDIE